MRPRAAEDQADDDCWNRWSPAVDVLSPQEEAYNDFEPSPAQAANLKAELTKSTKSTETMMMQLITAFRESSRAQGTGVANNSSKADGAQARTENKAGAPSSAGPSPVSGYPPMSSKAPSNPVGSITWDTPKVDSSISSSNTAAVMPSPINDDHDYWNLLCPAADVLSLQMRQKMSGFFEVPFFNGFRVEISFRMMRIVWLYHLSGYIYTQVTAAIRKIELWFFLCQF